MVHNLGGLLRGEEADDGAVSEESQVAVICDNMDWGTAPCSLVGRHLARPDVIDRADVASVEANARSAIKEILPRWVDLWDKRTAELFRICCAPSLELIHAHKGAILTFLLLILKRLPVDEEGKVVVHARKTKLLTQSHAAPDALLGRDEVGETLAYEGQAGKVGNIVDGDVLQDVDEEFVGERSNRTWGLGHALDFRRDGLNGERGEAGEEFGDCLRLRLVILLVLGVRGGQLCWLFARSVWFGMASRKVFLAIPFIHAQIQLILC